MINRKELIKGAIILAIANVIVKIIGAFYTIPLARMIGPEGMGIYNSAFQIYMWLFVICTTGFPIAISKMVSENIAIGRIHKAQSIFRISFILMAIMGFALSVCLFYFAGYITNFIGTTKSYYSLLAIAPSLFFVSITSVYRGCFQGQQNMIPTAISQIIESITKATIGLWLAYEFLTNGLQFASSGALFGVSFGAFLAMAYLSIYYFFNNNIIKSNKDFRTKICKRKIIFELLYIAIPITIGASIFPISNMIDLTMIMTRLQEIGYSQEYSMRLYGYLSGYAYKIIMIPSTIIIALSISIIPILSSAYAQKKFVQIEKLIKIIIKSSIIFAIPASVGICILSKEILYLLFKDSNASVILSVLSFAIIFITLVQVSTTILQGIGKAMVPVKNLLMAAVIKIILNYILVGMIQINILGAAISTIISYSVVGALNIICINKMMEDKIKIVNIFIKSSFASVLMSYSVLLALRYMRETITSNTLVLLISSITGAITYLFVMIIIKGIEKDDIDNFPYFNNISRYLYKYKILK